MASMQHHDRVLCGWTGASGCRLQSCHAATGPERANVLETMTQGHPTWRLRAVIENVKITMTITHMASRRRGS